MIDLVTFNEEEMKWEGQLDTIGLLLGSLLLYPRMLGYAVRSSHIGQGRRDALAPSGQSTSNPTFVYGFFILPKQSSLRASS